MKQSRYIRLFDRSESLFWTLNVAGWLGISLVTYLSLSLPYDQFDTIYLAHNLAQSVMGMLLCLPMRAVFRTVWHWSLRPRMMAIITAVFVLSSLWAFARLLLFVQLTGAFELWMELGGWIFPSIFVFLTWAAMYHGIKYYQLLQREQEALFLIDSQKRIEALGRAEARAEARDAQMALLRYQLNPHFLFNTLNSVMSLIKVGRSEQALQMTALLSDFLRYSLQGDRATLVSLREEIDTLKLYLQIEQVRFPDRLTIEYDIAAETEEMAIPSMLLQPLVENAIKYAIARAESGGTIRLSASMDAPYLLLSVEDSGADCEAIDSAAQDRSSSGIGLTNTRERLKTLFGERFRMQMGESGLGGCRVDLAVPATEVI